MKILKTVWAAVVSFSDMLDDAMRFRNETLQKSTFRGWSY